MVEQVSVCQEIVSQTLNTRPGLPASRPLLSRLHLRRVTPPPPALDTESDWPVSTLQTMILVSLLLVVAHSLSLPSVTRPNEGNYVDCG